MAFMPGGYESEGSDVEDEIVYSFYDKEDSNSKYFEDKGGGNLNNAVKEVQDFACNNSSLPTSQISSAQNVLTASSSANGSIPSKRPVIDKLSSLPLDDLRVAVMQGHLNTVCSFLEKGIWVDSILKVGWTALMYACSCGHSEIVRYLLERNADPNFHKDKFTPLMAACASSSDNEEELLLCATLLIEHGARVNDRERYHTTALIFAARDGRIKIVKKLLQHGAEVNKEDSKGRTALCWAASGGYGLVVRLLLDGGANPTHISSSGQSPADYAFNQNHPETGEILEGAAEHWKHKQNELPLRKRSSVTSSKNSIINDKRLGNKNQIKTYGDLELFLTGLNLSELIPIFQEHRLTFRDLLVITEEELDKLGIDKLGVKKKLLEGVHASHKEDWKTSSLPQVKPKQMSCPDAVTIMANIAKHLSYIEGTVVYMRHQIQAQPRILELGQETSNVRNLIQKTEDGIKNVRLLYDEMRFFKLYLDKIQDNVELIPSDLIVETMPSEETSRNKYTKKTMLAVIVVTATIGGLMWKKPAFVTQLVPYFSYKYLTPIKE